MREPLGAPRRADRAAARLPRRPREPEWALHFPAERDPRRLGELIARDREGALDGADFADPAAREVLRRALPAIQRRKRGPFRRLYYGAEFCEHLIPSPGRLERLLEAARAVPSVVSAPPAAGAAAGTPLVSPAGTVGAAPGEAGGPARGAGGGLPVSILTPYVTDAGLERVRALLAAVRDGAGAGTEVVVNDWGVLRLVRREFPGLTPVLGRLMSKMMRDPRVAPFYEDGPAEAHRALSRSSATLPIYRRYLQEMGVGRIELDALYQGIGLDLRPTGLSATLYLPFGYVASGRICLSGSLHLPRQDKFRFDLPCRHECQDYAVELRNTRSPYADSRGLVLFQRGNTVFYPQEGVHLERALAALDAVGIDRVVLELDVPM